MPTENTSSAARYLTLRDYVRVLRRYRIMIVALALAGAIAGYIAASRQTPVYQATAEVSFQDPSQALSLAQIGSNASQTPGEIASVNASTATTPGVMVTVKRHLRTPLSPTDLADEVSTSVATPSGLLEVSATDTDPAFAASLANAVAGAVINRDNAQTRAEFNRLLAGVQRQITRLSKQGGAAATQLGFYEDELARLNTVGALSNSAQLAYPAQVPTAPTTPGKFRNTALGLGLGLLLGIVVAFVRDAFDRRLRDLPDVTASFRLPVLGHVREESMGRVIGASAIAGEDQGLDLESFRILRRNLDFLDRERAPHSVLITSAVPEEGKSTVAASLGMAMAWAGKRTLLVDCDLRRPSLATRLHAQPRPGITDYLTGEATPQDILQTLDVASGAAQSTASGNGKASGVAPLVFISSGSRNPRAAELLGSHRLKEFLHEVSAAYDIVILDSSPLLPVSDTLELLPYVDAVLLCARASQTTRDQAAAARAALARFPERPTGLVITGVKSGGADDYGAYSYAYAEA